MLSNKKSDGGGGAGRLFALFLLYKNKQSQQAY